MQFSVSCCQLWPISGYHRWGGVVMANECRELGAVPAGMIVSG